MKWYKQPAALLLLLLVTTSLTITVIGFFLKHTVGRSSMELQDTMAIAVPFVLLQGNTVLSVDMPSMVPEMELPDILMPQIPPGKEREMQWSQELTERSVEPENGFQAVEEEYFDTALFIGDSRTVGLSQYGRLGKADYFADVGMSVFNLFEKTASDKGFTNQNLQTQLESKKYNTIYIMLGINEAGYPKQSFDQQLAVVLSKIVELQPNANIILEANLGITQEKEEESPTLSLVSIQKVNELIRGHADGKRIFYLDINPYFTDEKGYLDPESTGDGAHPYAAEYRNWSLWLKEYGVVERI